MEANVSQSKHTPDVLSELREAAARKWQGDPEAQRAGLFARAAAEVERLRADLAAMTADRDSWADQAEQRVADWDAERRKVEALRKAGGAVVARWDSPRWEWAQQGPTADLIAELRAALAATEGAAK